MPYYQRKFKRLYLLGEEWKILRGLKVLCSQPLVDFENYARNMPPYHIVIKEDTGEFQLFPYFSDKLYNID